MSTLASIIIVNYNTHEHLRDCLRSIKEKIKSVDFEVIVVDNNSTDRAIEDVACEFPEFYFYFRKQNDGFGAGCNFGANQYSSGAEYLVFVNPDIIFTDNSILKLHEFMENNKAVAVCTPLFINRNNELLYSYNFDINILWELCGSLNMGLSRIKKKLMSRPEIKNNIPFEIDWGLGALLFVRKRAFQEAGGFDERFFLYSEDNDLQFRIRKNGHKIMCIPYVKVIHYYGSSMDDYNSKANYNFYLYRSKMIYAYKHFKWFKRNILRFILIGGLLLRIFKVTILNKKDIRLQLVNSLSAILKSYKVF
ncbi:MAG: glycosyltransferase family 2 protein [Chlorobi bacterium]|nr:glycosyltransferase family 2 protein [Chlorobiota bacterium]